MYQMFMDVNTKGIFEPFSKDSIHNISLSS
jgi:hypothetical protein